MSNTRRTQRSIGCALLVAALCAACADDPIPAGPTPGPPPTTSERPDGEATAEGTSTLGPYEVTSDAIDVAVTCTGTRAVTVTVDGVGSFDAWCDSMEGEGDTSHVFDVRGVDTYTLTVEADPEQVWSVAVTTAPPPA
ncbi:hypothetical protein [Sanguibacter suaedae]|uniref:Lipoprotein n=1 Tax=Sanguibacter suaedae TaxID=2795737 RepID=A0A934MC75_9MICO|nr:hypothetical protein [Sanguibacter suaedae]MBI9113609.1 hypothetical protein [Sanguibacter suaedae]